MATTTNYGWSTPDNTGLVKDGALNIRTLGSAVDTTLFNITTGKNVGLVHLNTTAVTNATSTTISNVFSSTYDNYRIMIRGRVASGQSGIYYNNTLAGTPAAGAGTYLFSSFYISGNATSGSNFCSTAADTAIIGQLTDNSEMSDNWSIDVYSPALARRTGANLTGSYGIGQAATFGGFLHAVSTAYDGFRITLSASNWTGTISVFGYRK
jgi:hypothetical protein